MKKKQNRKARLHAKSRPCLRSHTGLKDVPWLNISGVWLQEAGFDIGEPIEITVRENQLIIKPLQ